MPQRNNDFLRPSKGFCSTHKRFIKEIHEVDAPTLTPAEFWPLHVVTYLLPEGELHVTVFRNTPLKVQGYGVHQEFLELFGIPLIPKSSPKALYALEMSDKDPLFSRLALNAREVLSQETAYTILCVPGFVCTEWIEYSTTKGLDCLPRESCLKELAALTPDIFHEDIILALSGSEFNFIRNTDSLSGVNYLDSVCIKNQSEPPRSSFVFSA